MKTQRLCGEQRLRLKATPSVRRRTATMLIWTAVAVIGSAWPRLEAGAEIALVRVDVVALADGYRASQLRGDTVVNSTNEKIGSLDDLIVSKDRVLFAIIQVGGFLGLGSHLVAVPYSSLQIRDDGKLIVLPGATKDQLKNLPQFKYR